MRKSWQIGVLIAALSAIILGLLVGLAVRFWGGKFEFEPDLYGQAELIEIDAAKYNELVAAKESFGLLVYQPLCTASYEFTQIVTAVSEAKQVSFYQIPFSQLKETALSEVVKYYPSFVLIKDGGVVDALDAESDEDTSIYKEQDAFMEWLTEYVRIRESGVGTTEETETESTEAPRLEAKLENVTYDTEKVNIYFFWGDGCPRCEAEWEFWESAETEYGDYFTLNAFEVWHNDENAELMETFAAAMGDELTGVPYTVIGESTFKGFATDFEAGMLEAIKTQYADSFDVYFDKLIETVGK